MDNIIKLYLREKKMLGTKQSTLSTYSYKLNSLIVPLLSNDEEEIYCKLEKYQSLYAAKTYTDIVVLLNDYLKFLYTRNYSTSLLKFPCPKAKKKIIIVFTENEQKILERYIYSNITPFTFGLLLARYTGLRVGELSALQHKDIVDGVVKVRKTLQRIKNMNGNNPKTIIVIDTPKTDNSVREIPIPPLLLEIYDMMPNKACEGYIISNTEKFMEPRQIERHFSHILEECNIGNKNFHVLRHTFATECVKLGFDIKTLSQILGHSNVRITLDRYVHSDIRMKQANMSKIKGRFDSREVYNFTTINESVT